MKILLGVALLVACGPQNGSATGDDGVVDAVTGSGSGSGSGIGSGHTPVVDTITCQTHTLTETAADGSKVVTDTSFALASLDPTMDFIVEQCDYTSTQFSNGVTTVTHGLPADPVCPQGCTCVASGAPLPTGSHLCYWFKTGAFIDGSLYITCGTKSSSFNASSVLTSSYESGYSTIRLHH